MTSGLVLLSGVGSGGYWFSSLPINLVRQPADASCSSNTLMANTHPTHSLSPCLVGAAFASKCEYNILIWTSLRASVLPGKKKKRFNAQCIYVSVFSKIEKSYFEYEGVLRNQFKNK